jgi:DNA-binding protein HU-beta
VLGWAQLRKEPHVAKTESSPRNQNKTTLAEALAAEMGFKGSVARETVETLFDIMARSVATGYTVSVTNFLSMERVDKDPRIARNPHTGETISVPERKAIRIVVSPRLNAYANSSDPSQATIRKSGKKPV